MCLPKGRAAGSPAKSGWPGVAHRIGPVSCSALRRSSSPSCHTQRRRGVGRISEWRVIVIARATAAVPLAVRRRIDAEVAGDPIRLERMSDRQTAAEATRWAGLLDAASAADRIPGHGGIPADHVRDLVRRTLRSGGGAGEPQVWIRRLFTDAVGQLAAMESASRLAPRGLAEFIVLRDQTCRTPWCDAPIRHVDHIIPVAEGGPTTAVNGQGLCEACNYAKTAFGWRARPLTDDGRQQRSLPPGTPTSPSRHRGLSGHTGRPGCHDLRRQVAPRSTSARTIRSAGFAHDGTAAHCKTPAD